MAEPIDWTKVPRSFGEGGWFWFSAEGQKVLDAIAEDAADTADEISKAFRLTFQSQSGQRVLRYLIAATIDQPTWVPGIPDPVHAGFAREGQNSIVREIIRLIGAPMPSAPVPPPPPKETPNATQPAADTSPNPSRDFTPGPDGPRRRRPRDDRPPAAKSGADQGTGGGGRSTAGHDPKGTGRQARTRRGPKG